MKTPFSAPKLVDKPWGQEVCFARSEKYAGKILKIAAGKRLSLQLHNIKEETLLLFSGEVKIHFNGDEFIWPIGQAVHIPPGTVHRFEAITDAILFEVSTPELEDVVRLADDYGRSG